jgi:hypothetical protein
MALQTVYYLLTNATPVTDLVALRIYPGVLPEGETLPAITIFDIDETPTGTKDSASAVDVYEVQISIHVNASLGYEQIKPIAAAIKAALNRITGTVNGASVNGLTFTGASPEYESDNSTFSKALRFSMRLNP